jgi:predicted secreted acid phosphatase
MQVTHLTKDEWLKACHFHDLSEKKVLEEVAKRVKNTPNSLVLLDLDSTLYEVGPRSHQILKEWVESSESAPFSSIRNVLLGLRGEHIGYSLKDTFSAIGLSLDLPEVQKAWESAKKFWAARFFTHDYLQYDHAYPGAAEFTRKIYDLGTQIVYLTGRDEPGMGEGTRRKLVQDGFPWNVPRTTLLMKKH